MIVIKIHNNNTFLISDSDLSLDNFIDKNIIYKEKYGAFGWIISIYEIGEIVSFLNDRNKNFEIDDKTLDKIERYDYIKSGDFLTEEKNIPDSFKVNKYELFGIQKVGVRFLKKLKRCILGDNVGFGKSVQSLYTSFLLLESKTVYSVLVVTKGSLIKKWINEDILEFFTNVKVRLIVSGRYKIFGDNKTKHKIDITSYGAIWRKNNLYLLEQRYDIIIFDECQKMKNYKSKCSKAGFYLSHKCGYLFLLSATYIEYNLSELYNIFKLIDRKILGDWKTFDSLFIKRDFWGGIKEYKNIELLQKKISPFILRRTPADIEEDFVKVEPKNYYIDMLSEQKELYDKLVDEAKEIESENFINPFGLYVKLRRISLSPELYNEEKDYSKYTSNKFEDLLEVIEGTGKSQIMIFCFFKDMVYALDYMLNKNKIKSVAVTGDLNKSKFDGIVDNFKSGNNKVLCSTNCLSEGGNFKNVDYVINFDLHFNPAVMEQRVGRITREFKKKTVFSVNLITNYGAELKIKNDILDKIDLDEKVRKGRINEKDIKRMITKNLNNFI